MAVKWHLLFRKNSELSNFSCALLLFNHHIHQVSEIQPIRSGDKPIPREFWCCACECARVCLCWPFWSRLNPLLLFVTALFVLCCIQYPYYTYTNSVAKMTPDWLKILRMRKCEWARPAADAEIIPLSWEVFGQISAVEGVLVCDLCDWVRMREWSVWGWDASKLRTCTALFGPLLPVLFHSPSLAVSRHAATLKYRLFLQQFACTYAELFPPQSFIDYLDIEMQGLFPPQLFF